MGEPDYRQRIDRVLDHIRAHLAEPLDLATLADVAHFSPWHFHRIFQALAGETLADAVRRLRVEAAARRLLTRPREPALGIALDVGFASAEVFTRAFKAQLGMTPTAWRRGGWRSVAQDRTAALHQVRQRHRKANQDAALRLTEDRQRWPMGAVHPQEHAMQIEIKPLPAMRLAYLRHNGPYGSPGIPEHWDRFTRWCRAQGLQTSGRLMLGIGQDQPDITPADKLRYDCCLQVDDGFVPPRGGELPIGVQAFAAGRFAFARYAGMGHAIGDAWRQLYSEWLPHSGHLPADRPGFELYDETFILDEHTGAFTCWLCLPIQGS